MKKLIALLSSVSLVATAGVAGIATVACGSSSNEATVPVSKEMDAAFVQLYYSVFGSTTYQITTENSTKKAKSTIADDISSKLKGKEINDKTVSSVTVSKISFAGVALTEDATLSSIIDQNPKKIHDVDLTLTAVIGDVTVTTTTPLVYRVSFADSLSTIAGAYINDLKALLAKTTEELTTATISAYDTKALTVWIRDVLQQGTINPDVTKTGTFIEQKYVGYDSSLKDYNIPNIPTALTIINNDSALADDITFGAYLYDVFNAQKGFPLPNFSAELTLTPKATAKANDTIKLSLPINDASADLHFIPTTEVSAAFELVNAEYASVVANKDMYLFGGGILPVADATTAKDLIKNSVKAYLDHYKFENELTTNQLSVNTVSIAKTDTPSTEVTGVIDYSTTDTYIVKVSFDVASASVSTIPDLVYTGIKTVSELNFNTEIHAFVDFMKANQTSFATAFNYQSGGTVTNFNSVYLAGDSGKSAVINAFKEQVKTFIMRKALPWHQWNFVNFLVNMTDPALLGVADAGAGAATISGIKTTLTFDSTVEVLASPTSFTSYTANTLTWGTKTVFNMLAAPDITAATSPVDGSPVDYDKVMLILVNKFLSKSSFGTTYPLYGSAAVSNPNPIAITTSAAGVKKLDQLSDIIPPVLELFALDTTGTGATDTNTINQLGYQAFAKALFQADNVSYYSIDGSSLTRQTDTSTFTTTGYGSGKKMAMGLKWTDPLGAVHYIGPQESQPFPANAFVFKLTITEHA